MLKYVQRVEYVVRDLNEMVAYLERNFGMKPEKLFEAAGKGKEAQYRVGQTLLRFKEPAPGTRYAQSLEKNGPSVREVAWGVENISQVAQELKARGMTLRDVEQGFHGSPHGFCTINFMQDPLGIDYRLFQLAEDPK